MKKNILIISIPLIIIFLFYFCFFKLGIYKYIYIFMQNIQNGKIDILYLRIFNILAMLTVMIIFSILGYLFSKQKGRNQLAWIVICFFLNLWGLIALWLLPDLNEIRSSAG